MGLTELGYRRRTYEEILQSKVEKAKELFGEDINTEENTALGKYIRINAYDQYNVEEQAELLYYSFFPQTSTGQTLDRHSWRFAMTRNPAVPAQYKVQVTGEAGETIDIGVLVSTDTQLNFYNTKETVIGEDGTCTIIVECVEAGTIGNISPNLIVKLVNPVSYIDEVKGISIVQAGEDIESDSEFLKRFEIVRDGRGSCNERSIISALLNIPTVRGAYVIANEDTVEVDGIPAKSIACYVDGGDDHHQEIAEAIFDKRPIGVGTYGDVVVPINYGALKDYEIKFSHSSVVGVYVKLNIITNNKFESGGLEAIKRNITNYINNLGIGVSLVTTTMYSQIYSVLGVVSAQIEVSKDGETYSTDNIEVQPYECCAFVQLTINDEVV